MIFRSIKGDGETIVPKASSAHFVERVMPPCRQQVSAATLARAKGTTMRLCSLLLKQVEHLQLHVPLAQGVVQMNVHDLEHSSHPSSDQDEHVLSRPTDVEDNRVRMRAIKISYDESPVAPVSAGLQMLAQELHDVIGAVRPFGADLG